MRKRKNLSTEEWEAELERRKARRLYMEHERYVRDKERLNAYSRAYYRAHREELLSKKRIKDRERALRKGGYKI